MLASVVGFESRMNRLSGLSILSIVVLLSVAALIPAWFHYDIIARDGAFQYIPAAKLFFSGNFSQAFSRPQLPLFPMMIALFAKLTGLDFEMSGRLVAVVAFIIAALGMFKVGAFLYGRLCGFLAFLFFITNWVVVSTSVDCLQESMQLAFILWANFFMFKFVSNGDFRKWRFLIISVILFVLGAMVRTTTALFLFAWFIIWVFRKKEGLGLRVAGLLILVLVPLLSVILFKDLPLFHQKKGFQVYSYVDMSPGLWGMVKNFPDTIGMIFDKGHPVLMGLAVIGFFIPGTRLFQAGSDGMVPGQAGTVEANGGLMPLYRIHTGMVCMLFLLMFFLMGWTTSRYILAPIIWLYPLVAFICCKGLSSKSMLLKVFIVLTALSCLAIWTSKSLTAPDPDRVAIRKSGEWILSQIGPGQNMLTNRDRLAFYAGAELKEINSDADIKGNERIIAVDVTNEGGEKLKRIVETKGGKLVKEIPPISIYEFNLK